jgi:hypothetical protein
MKKIVALLSLLLIPSLAIAQGYQIPYPAGTPRIENRTGASTQRANITPYSDQQIVLTDGSGNKVGPPGPASSWSACSAANTGTSFVTIYAGLASNKFYVTSISCSNTATVASTISFRDGNGATLYGAGIGNSTLEGVATWNQSFPTPLRASVVTAGLGFVMGTTATSTICCAAGYNLTN